MTEIKCCNCYWWKFTLKASAGFGECHGSAPQKPCPMTSIALFPLTSLNDYCKNFESIFDYPSK